MPDKPALFESITELIHRQAGNHVDFLNKPQEHVDSSHIDNFENCVTIILDAHPIPKPRKRGRLTFQHEYDSLNLNQKPRAYPMSLRVRSRLKALWSTLLRKNPDAEHLRARVAALISAELEHHSPLRFTMTQHEDLAVVFRNLGETFRMEGRPHHAAFAFDRASLHFLECRKQDARRYCQYANKDETRRGSEISPNKLTQTISWITCGYGLRPTRLLCWMMVQLVGFSTVLAQISSMPLSTNIYMTLVDYFNPLGIGDAKEYSRAVWMLLVVEGYTGALTSCVFFALLVRRWFGI